MNICLQVLQTHNDNLQEYLTSWSRKQQDLIETTQKTFKELALPVPTNGVDTATQEEPEDNGFLEHLQKAKACLLDLDAFQMHKPSVVALERHWVTKARFHLDSVLGPSKVAVQDRHELSPKEYLSHSQSSLTSQDDGLFSNQQSVAYCSEQTAIGDGTLEDITQMARMVFSKPDINDSKRKSTVNQQFAGLKHEHTKDKFSEGPCLDRMVSSFYFDASCALVVTFNAAILGFSASYSMTNLHRPEPEIARHLETAFIVFYTLEVLLRGYVFRFKYICGEDWKWNWFDILLVAVTLFENLRIVKTVGNVSFMRAFRLLKMIRLLRIVRLMKIFKELRLILSSISGGLRTMLWGVLLVSLIQYIAAVCFLQGITQLLQDTSDVSLESREVIDQHWCTIIRSMNTLFAACTGGIDWYVISDPLYEAGLIYYSLFILYLGFFILVIANTLTSIFLSATMENAELDHEMLIQRELEHKSDYIGIVKAFFEEIDDDESGDVTLEEFRKHLGNPKLRLFAESLDIPVEDAEQFFRVLSNNGAVTVDIDTFVVGCIKLRGYSKSVDLFGMYQMVKSMHRKLEELSGQVGSVERKTRRVEAKVERQESTVKLAILQQSTAVENDGFRTRLARIDKTGSQLEDFAGIDQMCKKRVIHLSAPAFDENRHMRAPIRM